jgi:hypothetical protein
LVTAAAAAAAAAAIWLPIMTRMITKTLLPHEHEWTETQM